MAIVVPILSEFKPEGFDKAAKEIDSFGGKLKSSFGKVADAAKIAAAAVAGVAIAAGAGAYKAIEAASDLAETQAKVGQIFGDSAKEIEAFADQAAKSLGQSKQDVLNAAGTFGIFGKAAGLTGTDLANFSNDFTGLASDLASFNNTSPQEAIDALGAALRGESEPLRRYGVMLDDATLKAKAAELGIYSGSGALTQQQKILAAQAAIWQQTGDAQGDFARTSDGLANQQRILKAQLANVVAEIGQKLLPIALKLADFFSQKVMPVIERLSDAFSEGGFAGAISELGDIIQEALPGILSGLQSAFQAIGDWLVNTGLPWLVEKLQQLGQALIDWIGPRIGPMLEKLGELLGKAANWIIDDGLPMLVDKLKKMGQAFVDWIKPNIAPMLGKLGELLAGLLDWILTEALPKIAIEAAKLAGALLGWIVELLPQAIVGLAKFIGELIGKLPELFVDLVTKFAEMGLNLGKAIVNAIADAVSGLFDKAGDVAKQFLNGIIGFINTQFIDRINDLLEFTVSAGPFKVHINPPDIPRIPKLAEGGIVTGPTLALIGEAGPEAVIPLDRPDLIGGAGQNVTVNVYGSVTSERDLIETIRRGLINAQRNGAQLVYSNT